MSNNSRKLRHAVPKCSKIPMMLAIMNEDYEQIKDIIENRGLDPNDTLSQGTPYHSITFNGSPFEFAIEQRKEDVALFLFDNYQITVNQQTLKFNISNKESKKLTFPCNYIHLAALQKMERLTKRIAEKTNMDPAVSTYELISNKFALSFLFGHEYKDHFMYFYPLKTVFKQKQFLEQIKNVLEGSDYEWSKSCEKTVLYLIRHTNFDIFNMLLS